MKFPRTFIPEKNLEEKTKDLLVSKPKPRTEFFPDGIDKDLLHEFNELYDNKDGHYNCGKEDLKRVAELAYALAMIAKKMGEHELKEYYGGKSVEIYKILDVQTIDDARPYHTRIKDVEIPDLMHEGVVIDRLSLDYKKKGKV